MKIFLLITKAEVGGAQMSVLNLARGLEEKGLDVKVGFGEGDFLPKELDKASVPYTNFKNLKRTHNPLANLFFIWEIKKYFDKNKYDVVHINSSNALFAALGAKLSKNKPKTVFTFRGMSILDENYKKSPILKGIYKIFFKFFLQFVDKPVFVSKQNLKKGEKEGLIKKGHLVYNGLSKAELNFCTREEAQEKLKPHLNPPLACPARSELCRREHGRRVKGRKNKFLPLSEGEIKRGWDAKEGNNSEPHLFPPLGKGRIKEGLKDFFIIGSIGRLAYQKNYEFLIDVFPKILKIKENAVAIIIGEGPERHKLEQLIKEKKLEDKVFLAGSINNASKYLKAFDLFVLPSRYEGLSITLIEALFSGIPILTTDVGGNKETLPSDQEIYELNDKKDFLDKFKKLTTEETQRKVSEQNLQHSDRFLLERTVDGYYELYS